jgi:CRISPR-associated exonuclease Cas4
VLYLALFSLILAIMLFLLALWQRRKAGIPSGRVIYADTSHWMKVEKPLFDKHLRLTGKPDYLVKYAAQVIPVEVKSGHSPREPRAWHVSQLAAYCLLVDSEFGNRPAHGILHYADRTLEIDFTPRLENATLSLIAEMQSRASHLQIDRSHHDQNRCLHCGYHSTCDQALRI